METQKATQSVEIGVVWGVMGHPRLLAMSPFDRAHTLIKFNRNYASVLYRFCDIASYLSKVTYINLSHLYFVPPLGDFIRISLRALTTKKLVSACYRVVFLYFYV